MTSQSISHFASSPFTWYQFVEKYNHECNQTGIRAAVNYLAGLCLAVAAVWNATFKNADYKEYFIQRDYWKHGQPPAAKPLSALEENLVSEKNPPIELTQKFPSQQEPPILPPPESSDSKKRVALTMIAAAAITYALWQSGLLNSAGTAPSAWYAPRFSSALISSKSELTLPLQKPVATPSMIALSKLREALKKLDETDPLQIITDLKPSPPNLFVSYTPDTPDPKLQAPVEKLIETAPAPQATTDLKPSPPNLFVSYTPDTPDPKWQVPVEKWIETTLTPQATTDLKPDQIRLFTSYTQDNPIRLAMSRKVMENHEQYSQGKGYLYQAFERNSNDGSMDKSLAYWLKIDQMNQLLNQNSAEKWFVWLDDDAVILNQAIRMEDVIAQSGGTHPDTHVIVTRDIPGAATSVNTGVLIVRNSDESRKFFKELWEMRHQTKYRNLCGGTYAYSNCPNQCCLHEQEAMHDLLQMNAEFKKIVNIIPQTSNGLGINTFERFDHFDSSRNMHLRYNDPPESKSKPGDFISQCTGLASKGKRFINAALTNLREECIDGLLKRVSNTKVTP